MLKFVAVVSMEDMTNLASGMHFKQCHAKVYALSLVSLLMFYGDLLSE